MQFSQQLKDGGSLVNLLIGIVIEGITVQHIEYLAQSDPQAYEAVVDILRKDIDYFDADTAIHNAFATEYQTFKNVISTMQSYSFPLSEFYDPYNEDNYVIDTIVMKVI